MKGDGCLEMGAARRTETRQQTLRTARYNYTLNKQQRKPNQPAIVPFNLVDSPRRGRMWICKVRHPSSTRALGWRNEDLHCSLGRKKQKGLATRESHAPRVNMPSERARRDIHWPGTAASPVHAVFPGLLLLVSQFVREQKQSQFGASFFFSRLVVDPRLPAPAWGVVG